MLPETNRGKADEGRYYLILALMLVAISTLVKAYYISLDAYELGTEGDEGARILYAAQLAKSGFDAPLHYLQDRWADIHPPADVATRAYAFKLAFALWPDTSPVRVAMSWSLALSAVGASLFVLASAMIAGGFSALVTSCLLAVSWSFQNPSLSGMGEGSVIAFFALQIFLLVKGLLHKRDHLVLASAVACCAATLFRPEPAFFVPGICLYLWCSRGFLLACAYGVIATLYMVLRTVIPHFFIEDSITILNFHQLYPFKGTPLSKFYQTGFGQALINDPFFLALFICMAIAAMALWIGRWPATTARTQLIAMLLVAVSGYLLLTVTSVVNGKTANASARLGYLPSYILMMAGAAGLAHLERDMTSLAVERKRVMRALGGLLALLALTWSIHITLVKGAMRAPKDTVALRQWILAHANKNDGLVIDRVHNRENWLVAYLSRYDKMCVYFYCPMGSALEGLSQSMSRNTKSQNYGNLHTVTHAFIADKRPKWIITHTGSFSRRWRASMDHSYGENATRMWSFIYPFSSVAPDNHTPKDLAGEFDTAVTERDLVLATGLKVQLAPEFKTPDFAVYRAFYPEP